MKNIFLIPLATSGAFLLVACGENPTQYSTPENYKVIMRLSGSGVDRLKELNESLQSGDAESIVLEPGLSDAEQKEYSDALAGSLDELISGVDQASGSSDDTSSSGSQGSQNSNSPSSDAPFQIKPVKSIGTLAGKGASAKKFLTACAGVMQVDESKLKYASDGESLSSSEVLVVILDSGELTTALDGASIRGVCVFSSKGAKITINAGSTKVGGILTYQSGANNEAAFAFSGGKLDSAMTVFSGNTNKVRFSSAGLKSCPNYILPNKNSGTVVCD